MDSSLSQFYSALWHSLLLPRMAADHDGEYMSFAGGKEVIQGRAGEAGYWYYDDFSMWDTYRATVPLQFLVAPHIAPDLVQSLGESCRLAPLRAHMHLRLLSVS